MNIGEKIKQRRLELEWSQRELASRMGYGNNSTITRIENGSVDIPQSRIVQFADVLGVSIQWLMGWEEVQKNNNDIADIVVRLRTDSEFLNVVKRLSDLDSDKLSSLLTLLK